MNSRENAQIVEQFESYIEALKKVMITFALNSNRLALTATYQLNANQEQSTKMKETLLPTFSYYKDNRAIEATAHNVSRPLIKIIDEPSEYCNVNTDVMFKSVEQDNSPDQVKQWFVLISIHCKRIAQIDLIKITFVLFIALHIKLWGKLLRIW